MTPAPTRWRRRRRSAGSSGSRSRHRPRETGASAPEEDSAAAMHFIPNGWITSASGDATQRMPVAFVPILDGPCWTRTSDLGIKSPERRTEARRARKKQLENPADSATMRRGPSRAACTRTCTRSTPSCRALGDESGRPRFRVTPVAGSDGTGTSVGARLGHIPPNVSRTGSPRFDNSGRPAHDGWHRHRFESA